MRVIEPTTYSEFIEFILYDNATLIRLLFILWDTQKFSVQAFSKPKQA